VRPHRVAGQADDQQGGGATMTRAALVAASML